MQESIGTPWLWAGFIAFVLAMLALDLGVFHKQDHEVTVREALAWTGIWVLLSLGFNAGIYVWFGHERAARVSIRLRDREGVVRRQHLRVHRGVLGVRGAGPVAAPRVALGHPERAGAARAVRRPGRRVAQSLSLAGLRVRRLPGRHGHQAARATRAQVDPRKNPLFRLFRRAMPTVDEFHEGRFTVLQAGKRYATPLLLVLVAIEGTDIVFAMDSIPAIFAVTRDPFIVFTSNIFAILGLRALYFALSGMMDKFHYLKYGLALVLMFVGAKMLLAGMYKTPIWASLAVIAALLAGSVVASLLRTSARRAAGFPNPSPKAEAPRAKSVWP